MRKQDDFEERLAPMDFEEWLRNCFHRLSWHHVDSPPQRRWIIDDNRCQGNISNQLHSPQPSKLVGCYLDEEETWYSWEPTHCEEEFHIQSLFLCSRSYKYPKFRSTNLKLIRKHTDAEKYFDSKLDAKEQIRNYRCHICYRSSSAAV